MRIDGIWGKLKRTGLASLEDVVEGTGRRGNPKDLTEGKTLLLLVRVADAVEVGSKGWNRGGVVRVEMEGNVTVLD